MCCAVLGQCEMFVPHLVTVFTSSALRLSVAVALAACTWTYTFKRQHTQHSHQVSTIAVANMPCWPGRDVVGQPHSHAFAVRLDWVADMLFEQVWPLLILLCCCCGIVLACEAGVAVPCWLWICC